MSGQLDAPAALTEKDPEYPLNMPLGGPQGVICNFYG
jgi:hypothetical protein